MASLKRRMASLERQRRCSELTPQIFLHQIDHRPRHGQRAISDCQMAVRSDRVSSEFWLVVHMAAGVDTEKRVNGGDNMGHVAHIG